MIDGEHNDSSFETLTSMVRAIEATNNSIVPLVRVSWNDAAEIKRVLDLGARGIVVPMVETAVEAEQAVDAMRFPPAGQRGVSGSRAAGWGAELDAYLEVANEELVTIVQIESQTAVENVSEIVAVDGVDGVFIGPVDLSTSLGVYGEWESPRFIEAIQRIITQAHAAGVSVGTLVGAPDQIPDRLEWGVDFIAVGTDKSTLGNGIQRAYEQYEAAKKPE